MGCIFYFFTWPLYLMYYMLKYMFKLVMAMVELMVIIIVWIISLFTGATKSNYSNTYSEDYSKDYSNKTNKSKVSKKQKVSWKEEEFEREADLWGLSKEDRRIAKEERMSPADFIEAEERDDDELFTDEWED